MSQSQQQMNPPYEEQLLILIADLRQRGLSEFLESTLGGENEEVEEESLCGLCNAFYLLSHEWPIEGMCPQHEANVLDRNLLERDFEIIRVAEIPGNFLWNSQTNDLIWTPLIDFDALFPELDEFDHISASKSLTSLQTTLKWIPFSSTKWTGFLNIERGPQATTLTHEILHNAPTRVSRIPFRNSPNARD